ncbi:hypothetical protein CCACVL1_25095 [Corchorus capsularis]|uniref:Uncharacterized protein n=1 Tax=Corchorus capsularis TaxID=210143 RepID=A0A1R3GLV9_COCAP|nr:hypothetical protein CCACVL1_25095 [Corchorus capsularis]
MATKIAAEITVITPEVPTLTANSTKRKGKERMHSPAAITIQEPPATMDPQRPEDILLQHVMKP